MNQRSENRRIQLESNGQFWDLVPGVRTARSCRWFTVNQEDKPHDFGSWFKGNHVSILLLVHREPRALFVPGSLCTRSRIGHAPGLGSSSTKWMRDAFFHREPSRRNCGPDVPFWRGHLRRRELGSVGDIRRDARSSLAMGHVGGTKLVGVGDRGRGGVLPSRSFSPDESLKNTARSLQATLHNPGLVPSRRFLDNKPMYSLVDEGPTI